MTQPRLFALRREGKVEDLPKLADGLVMLRERHPGFPLAREEYRFASAVGRQWRFDYAFPEYRVAVEFEGGSWGRMITDVNGEQHRVVQSRHTDPMGLAEDCRKYNTAAVLGWLVLRATDQLIRDRSIFDQVVAALRARGWKEACGEG